MADTFNAIQLMIHIDELGGQKGILIEPIIDQFLVNNKGVREGILIGAREDEELVGVLSRIRLMGKELKSLFELALFTKRLN